MQKEYSKLIIDIQKKSNIEVLKVRDLKYLQEYICCSPKTRQKFHII